MTVFDLNRDQLIELKQRYLQDTQGDLSWGELAEADDLISDKFIMEYWADTEFVPDDFFSSADEEDEDDVVAYYLEIDAHASKEEIVSDLREIARAIEDGYYSGLAPYGTSWAIERE